MIAKVNTNCINVNNLMVEFKTGERSIKAVRGIDFSLKEGELLAIVGESGSGKSVSAMSLLNLNGYTAKTSGEIYLNNKNLLDLKAKEIQEIRRSEFGFIFQEPSTSFDPIYDIGKTFFETFRLVEPKISKKESDKRAITLLEEVHIDDAAERLKNYPHQFSGGMLQRIMIALALANNPRILIADEPTTALDVTIQGEIISLIMEQKRKRNLSIIFITHDLALVSSISDRIIVMYGGLVMETGTPSAMFLSPKSPYTKGLLESIPREGSHYTLRDLPVIPGNVISPFETLPGCPFAPRCFKKTDRCERELPEYENSVRCFHPLKGDKG